MNQGVKQDLTDPEKAIDQYRIAKEPFYRAVGDEVTLFKAAADRSMPVMLKGPTGCGKTRFIQHMAYQLARPLITVACHEDLTASDLVGRYLLKGEENGLAGWATYVGCQTRCHCLFR